MRRLETMKKMLDAGCWMLEPLPGIQHLNQTKKESDISPEGAPEHLRK
jgi:hypothetical protein